MLRRAGHWWIADGDRDVVVVRFRHVDLPLVHEDAGAKAIGITEARQGRRVREVLVGGELPACPICAAEAPGTADDSVRVSDSQR
jgi:hypothetical protein